jgi:hypothetical protein
MGNTRSCGCLQKEIARKKGAESLKHGLINSRLYRIWAHMKERCHNPMCADYKNYGGRGIMVCNEWEEFTPFYKWAMANGYKDNLTLERIEINGNYEPENCKWIPKAEQANNKRNNRLISYKGQQKTLAQWANILGLRYGLLHTRLSCGWSVKRVFETPGPESGLGNIKTITYRGKSKSIAQWARDLGIPYKVLYGRLYRGQSIEQIIKDITA